MLSFRRGIAIWKQRIAHYPRIVAGIKIAALFGLFWGFSMQTLDPDFGWHLAAGNYIRQHWVPAHDIYTYTARNYRWIDHEWGNDVLTSVVYQIGGYGLTAAVFAGAWTLSLCLFRQRIRFAVLLLATIAMLPYAGIRPTVWTVLCVALLLGLVSRATLRAKIAIPLLFLVWVNLHGGFIIGLALLVYFFLKYRRLSWLFVLLASILVSFINPYGPRLYVEVAHTLFDPALHTQITEWRSFYLRLSGWLFVGLWFVGFWLYDKNKLRNWVSVTPLLLLATMSASRNLPLFVVSSLRDIDRYYSYFKLPKRLDEPSKLLIAVFALFIATVAGYYLYGSYFPWTSRYATYPVPEVAYLQSHSCPGNLFNDYTYGGYLIWKLPGTPVFIDGRMPTWHDPSGESYIDRYEAILKKSATQKTAFTHYHIRCALLAQSTTDRRLQTSLKKQGWSTASTGNGAVLLLAPKSS
jgi:hypothetical protein